MPVRYRNIIPYFGGKTPHLGWMLKYFPPAHHFVDAMCGSAVVALNVQYPLITINDLNGDLINLFRVLRDSYDELFHKIQYTPFSREEFVLACEPTDDPIERARRFYIRANQGFGATTSQNNHKGWGGEYIKQSHHRVDTWNSKTSKLQMLSQKLREFQIDNVHVHDLLDRYDHADVFIYLDPPYVLETRNGKKRYKIDFNDEESSEPIRLR